MHWLIVPISAKNYEHILTALESFKINYWKNYHDLYLKVIVLLLPYPFETFNKESINSFKLDPAHYSSIPGYSLDAMLKFTDVNLKVITEIEMYKFIESVKSGIFI